MAVKHTLRVWRAYLRVHYRSAMEYRVSFIMQAIGMILNDAAFLAGIYLLLSVTGPVNGYGYREFLILFAMGAISIGSFRLIGAGFDRSNDDVHSGKFDTFLTMPIDEMFHVAISRTKLSGAGDAAMGVVLVCILAPAQAAE